VVTFIFGIIPATIALIIGKEISRVSFILLIIGEVLWCFTNIYYHDVTQAEISADTMACDLPCNVFSEKPLTTTRVNMPKIWSWIDILCNLFGIIPIIILSIIGRKVPNICIALLIVMILLVLRGYILGTQIAIVRIREAQEVSISNKAILILTILALALLSIIVYIIKWLV
jgi:hypothetical protein